MARRLLEAGRKQRMGTTLRSCEELRREHELMGETILGLEALMKSGSGRADVPLAGALDFFTGFVARCHEHKEQEGLLPALEARGADPRLFEGLRADRAEGDRLLTALRGLPSRQPLAAEGHRTLQAYLTLLSRHIGTEDEIFVLAARLLSSEDDAALERTFVGIEERELRSSGDEAFTSLAHALARAAGALAALPADATATPLARHVMRPGSRTAAPDDSLARAVELMQMLRARELAVVSGGSLVGILTRSDLEPYRGHYEWTRVGTAMSPDPLSVRPDMPVAVVAHLLLRSEFNAVPVTENGALLGMISRSDMLRGMAGKGGG